MLNVPQFSFEHGAVTQGKANNDADNHQLDHHFESKKKDLFFLKSNVTIPQNTNPMSILYIINSIQSAHILQ
jgi:hypothetical protein